MDCSSTTCPPASLCEFGNAILSELYSRCGSVLSFEAMTTDGLFRAKESPEVNVPCMGMTAMDLRGPDDKSHMSKNVFYIMNMQ